MSIHHANGGSLLILNAAVQTPIMLNALVAQVRQLF